MMIGYMRRQDNELSLHREILWGLYSWNGLGKRKKLKLSDFHKLHSEKRSEKKHIKTSKQANDLIKRFDNGS